MQGRNKGHRERICLRDRDRLQRTVKISEADHLLEVTTSVPTQTSSAVWKNRGTEYIWESLWTYWFQNTQQDQVIGHQGTTTPQGDNVEAVTLYEFSNRWRNTSRSVKNTGPDRRQKRLYRQNFFKFRNFSAKGWWAYGSNISKLIYF